MRIHDLRGNTQRLDGGAMFGNVPRALWSRWCPPDDAGRIELACRALLVDEGDRKVLLETGIGAFFDPKLRARFGVVEDRHVLLDSLAALGLDDTSIDVVVLSHLHFDHAGGLLAPWRAGEAPRLLFPRARFVVGRTALERARAPHPRDRASFIADLPRLLEDTGRLVVVEDTDDAGAVLGERYRVQQSQGHTPGMLHTTVLGAAERVFFCADLVPGMPWVHLPVTMGYDRFPERLIDEKAAVYAELGDGHGWLFFTHDATTAVARLARDDKGRWHGTGARGDFAGGWDIG